MYLKNVTNNTRVKASFEQYLKNYIIFLQRIPGKHKNGVRQKSEII